MKAQPITAAEINKQLDGIIIEIRLANPAGKWNAAIARELAGIKNSVSQLENYARELRSELDKQK